MKMHRPFQALASRRRSPPTPLSLTAGGVVLALALACVIHFSLTIYQLHAHFPTVLGMGLLGALVSLAIWALPRWRWLAVVLVVCAAGTFVWYNRAQLLYGAQACLTSLSIFWTVHTRYP